MNLHPAAARSLDLWHSMVASGDLARLPEIVRADAVFRSPVAHTPYESAAAVVMILNAALRTFEDFKYHRELASEDGLNVVLEFSAHVGGKELKGIDFIRFDEEGRIADFEVMVRPMSGLQALGTAMAARVGAHLQALKA
ncbi:nuclear transport factor 2 family protein [Pseudoduganella sp. UC29_106]|uniref:nuclear transport factor 2 family protein n=1 Tax=Pseudoduganella sp. UC29_106 TaxID=3374553 RepID=UPI00375681F2